MVKIFTPVLGMSPISSLGGEIYEYQTIKGFTKRGIKVIAYLPKNRLFDKRLKNLRVIYAPITHIVPPWIFSFICLPTLFRVYQNEEFDILKIQTPRFLGLAAIVFHLFYPKVPIICSGVTVDKPGYLYWVEKWGYKISSAIIVQSEYMKSYLVQNYQISKDKIHVTYGGILDSSIKINSEPKRKQSVNYKTNRLVYMGVLIKRKNPVFLLSVMSQLTKKIPNVELIYIGTGPEKKNLLNKVKELNLQEKVFFVNSAYGKDKNYWFRNMDIFLLPSTDEGFGLVVTEAMTFGKVVITTKLAAFPEIIKNGETGFTLELNEKKWVETISRLLENSDLRSKIGNKARTDVRRRFNWNKMYNLNKEIVLELLK